jgi:hypothetical protein
MKQIRPLSVLNLILTFVPWTILILRQYDFALQSPAAEIIITVYCIYIAGAFAFSLYLHTKKNMRDILSGIALILNSIYLAGALVMICMSIPSWIH